MPTVRRFRQTSDFHGIQPCDTRRCSEDDTGGSIGFGFDMVAPAIERVPPLVRHLIEEVAEESRMTGSPGPVSVSVAELPVSPPAAEQPASAPPDGAAPAAPLPAKPSAAAP